jgi:hypothetical protein
MVIIGTPVWASNMSTPVRTYITENKEKLKNVAFFCTEGNSGDAKTLDAMAGLCGKKATATLVVKARDISKGDYMEKIKKFASEIKGQKA